MHNRSIREVIQLGPLTLVINGVPKSKRHQHGEDDGQGGSVLAVEVASLDAAARRIGRRALGELRVECDEGAEVCALPRSLLRHNEGKKWVGVVLGEGRSRQLDLRG